MLTVTITFTDEKEPITLTNIRYIRTGQSILDASYTYAYIELDNGEERNYNNVAYAEVTTNN